VEADPLLLEPAGVVEPPWAIAAAMMMTKSAKIVPIAPPVRRLPVLQSQTLNGASSQMPAVRIARTICSFL
jgi:hypothetical protein